MNAPGGTEEIDFKSYSGYLALLIALAALVAIPALFGYGTNTAKRTYLSSRLLAARCCSC